MYIDDMVNKREEGELKKKVQKVFSKTEKGKS